MGIGHSVTIPHFAKYPGRIICRYKPEMSFLGPSAGTGKLCIFGHLGLVFIWSCFVSCLLLLLYYVICAPVLTEGTSFLVKLNLASKLNHQRKDKVLSFNSSFHLPWQPKASS